MHVSVKKREKFSLNQVLLDNQRNICLLKPEMFINVQQADILVRISGAGCIQFVVYDKWYLQDFFPGYASIIARES